MQQPTFVRRAQLGAIVVVTPLLAASACDEPDIQFSVVSPMPAFLEHDNPFFVTIQNGGGADATLGEISAEALGLSPPFAIDAAHSTCTTGQVLAKSYVGLCTLRVLLKPSNVDFHRETIELRYSWGDGESRTASQDIMAIAAPPLQGFTTGGDFGMKPLHQSTINTYLIQNRSSSAVILGDLSDAGLGLSPPFARAGGTCTDNQSLSLYGTCTIGIRFTPTAVQAFASTATLRYGFASRGTLEFASQLNLQGTGAAPVRVSANLPLMQPAAPGTSRRDTVTFTNWGGAPAVLGTVSDAALGLAPPFSIAGGTCTTGATLAPQTGSCTLELQFSPAQVGTFQDELALAYTYANGAAFSISKRLSSRAEASPSTNCFDTGCAVGQVCSGTTPGVGTCIDVPPPPPNCMAPCLWEAQRHCLPVLGECTQEGTPTPTLTCDLDTGWAVQETIHPAPDESGGRVFSYRRFGSECFGERRSGGRDFYYSVGSAFTDGSQPIAYADNLFLQTGERNVYCGPYIGTQQPPAGITPFLERQSPECSAWFSQYFGQMSCRSASPGSCSGL